MKFKLILKDDVCSRLRKTSEMKKNPTLDLLYRFFPKKRFVCSTDKCGVRMHIKTTVANAKELKTVSAEVKDFAKTYDYKIVGVPLIDNTYPTVIEWELLSEMHEMLMLEDLTDLFHKVKDVFSKIGDSCLESRKACAIIEKIQKVVNA